MTWLKVDDEFPEHKKVRRLSDGAFRLHVTAMCLCAKDETDGRVAEADLDDMKNIDRLRKFIPALVLADLWEVIDGGWLIHDFLDYNPSHEQLVRDRASARDRQARAREKREESRRDSRRDSRVSHSEVTADVTRESHDPVPTRPDPSRPVPKVVVPLVSGVGASLHGIASYPEAQISDDAMQVSR